MDIYLEFRLQDITTDGVTHGLDKKEVKNSIRWKTRPLGFLAAPELEGAKYDIFLEGIYEDADPDIDLKTLVVSAERSDNLVREQLGGFVPRNNIINIPLHITTEMQKDQASVYAPVWGIDGMNPMEGGIRAQMAIDASDPSYALETRVKLAEAIIEQNGVHNLYEYIGNECN